MGNLYDFEFDDVRSKVIAFGFWACADGRSDVPKEDRNFVAITKDITNEDLVKVFEEYFRMGHYVWRDTYRGMMPSFFTDAKYARLQQLIPTAQNLGEIAAFSFVSPEFACNDPRFVSLCDGMDETWTLLLTYEWSYGYDKGLDTVREGAAGYKTTIQISEELSEFARIRMQQKEHYRQHHRQSNGESKWKNTN